MLGITVTYQTKELFETAYNSIRKFLPGLHLMIVDGSPRESPCYEYVKSLAGPLDTVFLLEKNIGHGLGMHHALQRAKDEKILIFDSDIEMLQSPVKEMEALLAPGVYGVGEIYKIGRDGLHRNPVLDLPYLRPYFMLISLSQYFRFHRYIHHGSPCVKAMLEINHQGLSENALIPFSLQGYIRHDWGGTRKFNRSRMVHEIPNSWERL